MQVKIDPSALERTKWHEYVVRFVFGGFITAAAGILAKEYGACVGGLFLAFPAIFPASATLIEKHEKEKKQEQGFDGTERGREAAGVDAAGSAMGSIGLLFLHSSFGSSCPATTIGWCLQARPQFGSVSYCYGHFEGEPDGLEWNSLTSKGGVSFFVVNHSKHQEERACRIC
jgi:hypothetical protein